MSKKVDTKTAAETKPIRIEFDAFWMRVCNPRYVEPTVDVDLEETKLWVR